MFANGVTVVIVRKSPGGTDVYGDPVTSSTSRTDLPGCGVAPRYSSEPTDRGRQGVIVGLSLYPPASSGLLFTDQIEVSGVLYDIDGSAGVWRSPFTGWAPGDEVALRRAQG